MARPRLKSNGDVLDAALRVLRRGGPGNVTFQAVSAECGLSAPTLVQRFSSKAGLLQAALLRAWDLLEEATAAAAVSAPQGPEGAVAFLVALSGDYGEDDAYGEGLLLLREDMVDPVLRARGMAWESQLINALARRLEDADGPRADLARLMLAQWQGAILWWGFRRNGALPDAVRRALSAWCAAVGQPLLAPASAG